MMNCTRCNQQPISFLRFLLKINPFNIQCQHCGEMLKPGKSLRRYIYGAVALGAFLAMFLSAIRRVFDLLGVTYNIIFILFFLLVAVAFEWYAWNKFTFIKKEEIDHN